MSTTLLNFLLILANISLAVSGQLAIKAGMQKVGYINSSNFLPMMMQAFTNIHVLAGLMAYIIAAGTWILVLSRVDLSYAYPMLSLGYILVLILSIFVLHEEITLPRIVGTLLIMAGVMFIFRS